MNNIFPTGGEAMIVFGPIKTGYVEHTYNMRSSYPVADIYLYFDSSEVGYSLSRGCHKITGGKFAPAHKRGHIKISKIAVKGIYNSFIPMFVSCV